VRSATPNMPPSRHRSYRYGIPYPLLRRYGIRGLLIDPYNELDSRRPRDTPETDYIREMLSKVRRFARDTDCHVWFVAHPRQQKVLSGQAPGLYDISGSAHWFNKTDNGVVVHRWVDGGWWLVGWWIGPRAFAQ
jgi:twinkle protein